MTRHASSCRNSRLFCLLSMLLTGMALSLGSLLLPASGQSCPPNIDFESGSLDGWTCYSGYVAGVNGQNIMSINPMGGPDRDRHTLIPRGSGQVDYYGGFPVNCPNGSGYSLRLGNDRGGGEAEGVSYEFTIPANRNEYTLIYHYAVVFENPDHLEFQQPRMTIEITNVTDNAIINCSSFSFYPFGSLLPGFFEAPVNAGNGPVWCKDWSAVSVNLDGLAGKTIRLFFKTADCTFRRHFGYAYIDVNSECSAELVGSAFCPDDTAVNVLAPHGYQSYTWYNQSFTSILGREQMLRFTPPPPTGTAVAVEVVPYDGYGCRDTLYVRMSNTLMLQAEAGPDALYCNTPVPLGVLPREGRVYSWYPSDGLSNPDIANPFATPDSTTTYELTMRNSGGGCRVTDTVIISASPIKTDLSLRGSVLYCRGSGDSTILTVQPGEQIQWYRDGVPMSGVSGTECRVFSSGMYHAVITNAEGCSKATASQKVVIEAPVPGIIYPEAYAVIGLPLRLSARNIGIAASWSPANQLDNREGFGPVFTGDQDQMYHVTITTAAGCVTVDTQVVKTVDRIEVFVPNAFTPNNDGKNDYLKPLPRGIKEIRSFRIFNRWGQLIYETAAANPGWDGKVRGLEQPTQVVVWLVEAIGLDGKTYLRKGTTTLIR